MKLIDKDAVVAEIERLKESGCASPIVICDTLLSFIDSLQEEPVKIKKGCKYRSICNVTNNDTGNISFVAGKIYLAPEDDTLVSEENGWLCDTSEDASNFELVEEPVSEELGEIILEGANFNKSWYAHPELAFKAGAKWQKEQMIANTADAMIGLPYENKDGGYTHLVDVSRPLPVGDNKIAIIFKEE